MAGIGDRMGGEGDFLFFDSEGYPISKPGNPVPDDETLKRLGEQYDEWHRRVPSGPGAAPGKPLHWQRRPRLSLPK